MPVGVTMGAYDAALKYTKQRKQFGSALAGFQLVQEKLVRLLGNTQAMFLMSWRLTELFANGKQVSPGQSSLVKVHLPPFLHVSFIQHAFLLCLGKHRLTTR